jgi:VanZ family protein
MPTSQLPEVSYNDKFGHALAYFAMMAWFGQIYGARRHLVLALLAMGGAIELLQGWSGYRDMSGLDMLANTAGVAAGWLLSRVAPGLLAMLDRRLP